MHCLVNGGARKRNMKRKCRLWMQKPRKPTGLDGLTGQDGWRIWQNVTVYILLMQYDYRTGTNRSCDRPQRWLNCWLRGVFVGCQRLRARRDGGYEALSGKRLINDRSHVYRTRRVKHVMPGMW